MIGIRQKILLGYGGILLIVAVMGFLTVTRIDRLGSAVDVILRENYRSVVASQKMMETIDKIDTALLSSLAGRQEQDLEKIRQHEVQFRIALAIELGNITLPGEGEKAKNIARLFERYAEILHEVADRSRPLHTRKEQYFKSLLPLFTEIKSLAGQVLAMNQASMIEAGNTARSMASSAHNSILGTILASAVISILFSYQSRRWILKPIRKLIASANEIRSGNLDVVIEKSSNDEIGILSGAFNEMALSLRKMKKNDEENLQRTHMATQEVMNLLPTPIAIINPEGIVTVATQSARELFGLQPGHRVRDVGTSLFFDIVSRSIKEMRTVETDEQRFIQKFIGSHEYFYQPVASPVPPLLETDKLNGTVLLFRDVTQAHEQKEMKRSVVSTVSHQLRTPLTSLRMSIHLLLEEKIGSVNEKQGELLLSAREDSERLTEILDELLDLNRIEAGKAGLDLQPQQPGTIVSKGIEPFLLEARDKGISLITDIGNELPVVHADMASMQHVFANLLSNAVRFTFPGGTITVRAQKEHSNVRFSVEDSGQGIAQEHLQHIFDLFYQVPGKQQRAGVGLGLAIVKRMVEAHGGSIRATSSPGKGSAISFTLPAGAEKA
ncbi:MAG: cell wall metabolism sensor histidine kinase WalK [Chlorobiaceae bacterium]|nr:cell wall metabolism sensor histidine kinase WalK [Chlorobiaceae bacterium]NTV61198.1 cell wall metabolism sensor histidine kinase WalK [Chlorobiaceae bacterium]